MEIVAEENYSRLDVFLCDELGLSRSQVQRVIKNKNITCYINTLDKKISPQFPC